MRLSDLILSSRVALFCLVGKLSDNKNVRQNVAFVRVVHPSSYEQRNVPLASFLMVRSIRTSGVKPSHMMC